MYPGCTLQTFRDQWPGYSQSYHRKNTNKTMTGALRGTNRIFILIFFMFQFCFFISIAFSYCVETQPAIHYPAVVERSTELITRHEWLALEAYPDTEWWTIGYGTRSHAWEVITEREAYARMLRVVQQSVNRVMYDFPEANENQIIALTSVFYNCWGGYKNLKKHGIEYHKTPGFCQLPWYSGLVIRREEERKLLFQ